MKKLSEIKCPECKQNTLSTLTEILQGGTLEFLVEDGKLSNSGVLEHGSPSKVLAACECGHEWVLRNIKSTDHIESERFKHFLNEDA